jgi:hypothetical protein
MSSVVIVWLIVGLVSTVAVLAVLLALAWHVIVLMRTLGRFQRETASVTTEIAAQGDRASARGRRRGAERSFGRPPGRAVR